MRSDLPKTVPLVTMDKIVPGAGKYILLKDYGQEGISVAHQCNDLAEALKRTPGEEWAMGFIPLIPPSREVRYE